MKKVLNVEDRQKEMEKDNQSWWKHPFYDKDKWNKTIAQQREFSIWLMTRYNKVIDNITAHSYAK